MGKIHLFSGIAMLVIFALTGQYMIHALALPESEFDAQRMMYRASHMYLLFAGSANVLAGIYWSPLIHKLASIAQGFGSLLVIASQIFLLMAFWYEPPVVDQDRLLTLAGCVSLLVGVGGTLIAKIIEKRAGDPRP